MPYSSVVPLLVQYDRCACSPGSSCLSWLMVFVSCVSMPSLQFEEEEQ